MHILKLRFVHQSLSPCPNPLRVLSRFRLFSLRSSRISATEMRGKLSNRLPTLVTFKNGDIYMGNGVCHVGKIGEERPLETCLMVCAHVQHDIHRCAAVVWSVGHVTPPEDARLARPRSGGFASAALETRRAHELQALMSEFAQ